MGLEQLSLKDQKLHYHPMPPLDQNVVPYPMAPICFQFFSHPMPLGVKPGALHVSISCRPMHGWIQVYGPIGPVPPPFFDS